MNFVLRLWHWQQRRIDLQVLWPACIAQAHSLDRAKAAFAMHAFNDPAWLELGEDEIYQRINTLEEK